MFAALKVYYCDSFMSNEPKIYIIFCHARREREKINFYAKFRNVNFVDFNAILEIWTVVKY